MKKIMFSLAMVAACAWAQEAPKNDAESAKVSPAVQSPSREVKAEKAPWPVCFAFNTTKNIDVIGMRFNCAYGACEGLTGFDLGLIGRCRYMEGFQLNLLRNEAEDVLTGFQIGFYNTAGRADLFGAQIGLWNEAQSISGVQVGLVNVANSVSGFQVGLINRCESLYGLQAGAVNVIRSSELSFLPLVNVGFEYFGSPAF